MHTTNLPEHCTPTAPFLALISKAFDTCVPTPLALLSTALGILSILSWLFAQLPQIFKNYSLKSASGLSIYFLAEWLLGDATNLVGALLTKQAAWQVVVAGYYVTVDVALVCQYFWYCHVRPWRQETVGNRNTVHSGTEGGGTRSLLVGLSPPENPSSAIKRLGPGIAGDEDAKPKDAKPSPFRVSKSSFSPKEKSSPNSYRTISRQKNSFGSPGPSPKTMLLISMLCAVITNASPLSIHSTEHILVDGSNISPSETAGRIISWVSTLLYLGSRFPQLYKNFHRRSTAGLSPALFVAAFCGNLFYSTSLLTNPLAWSSYPPYGLHGWAGAEGSDRRDWVTSAAPFWLGAAGVLVMDAAMGVQFLMYGEEKKVVIVKDERGRSRWRRVNGWMRGWVPSPNPVGVEPQADERPLLSRNVASDGGYGTT